MKWTGIWGVAGILSAIIGLGLSYIISMITGVKFKITYMPKVPFADGIALITIIIVLILAILGVNKFARNEKGKKVALIGALWFNTILLVVFMFILPGGSYLFVWPIVTGIFTIILINRGGSKLLLLIPMSLTIIMYVPVLYNIYIALTIGALAVVLLLALIAVSVIVSIINYIF